MFTMSAKSPFARVFHGIRDRSKGQRHTQKNIRYNTMARFNDGMPLEILDRYRSEITLILNYFDSTVIIYPHMLSPTPPNSLSEIAFVLVNQSSQRLFASNVREEIAAFVLESSSDVLIASQ